MPSATDLQNRLIEAIQKKYQSRIFRQNTGSAYPVTSFKRAWPLLSKGIHPPWLRPVSFGVVGQGDIGGWISIGGKAICTHIEVKIDDEQSDGQRIFEKVLMKHGGIYVVAHSVEEGMGKLVLALQKYQ